MQECTLFSLGHGNGILLSVSPVELLVCQVSCSLQQMFQDNFIFALELSK